MRLLDLIGWPVINEVGQGWWGKASWEIYLVLHEYIVRTTAHSTFSQAQPNEGRVNIHKFTMDRPNSKRSSVIYSAAQLGSNNLLNSYPRRTNASNGTMMNDQWCCGFNIHQNSCLDITVLLTIRFAIASECVYLLFHLINLHRETLWKAKVASFKRYDNEASPSCQDRDYK